MGLPAIPGLGKAVHSSILIDTTEYEFCSRGIVQANGPQSHERFRGKPETIDMRTSPYGGQELLALLSRDFAPGTYDLLRKNCNTFSDCALMFLVGQRMKPEHRALEKLGESLDRYTPIIGSLFKNYKRNSNVDNFETMVVIERVEEAKRNSPAPVTQHEVVLEEQRQP